MPFRKITALGSDSPTEQAKLYGQNSEFFNVNTRVLSIVPLSTAAGKRCPGGDFLCDKAAGLWAMIKRTLWTVVYKVITYMKLHYRLTPTDDLLVAHFANFN